MTWSNTFMRRASESGAPTRSRIFIYLALAVISLLLSYQLVLNHDSLGALSPWKPSASPSETPTANTKHIDGWAGSAMNGTLQEAVKAASASASASAIPTKSAIISPAATPRPNEKELVIAAMRNSDMSWVDQNLPDWPKNIYRADVPPGEAEFTVPENKGNEAMVYLTYLIDRYDSLPDVMVFMHGGRYQWHNDNPLYDSVISIKDLQLPFVRQSGYVNLRCAWAIGCPAELEPARYLRERPDDVGHPTAMEFPNGFMELFPGEEVPEVVGVPCCSQFALSREVVRARGKEEYERMRKWLIESTLDAGISGRIFEYAWHIMFGKQSQFCLDMTECYCNTYGYCDLTPEQIANQWVWRGLILPEGWPELSPEPERVQEPV
ncbi:Protein of unknown function DUF3431 [Penicillium herquei]|nr:Protein of unknown function DUF3431 [Penicillium herquei]